MTVRELTGNMYYSQRCRVYEVDKRDRLIKKLKADITNQMFRSDVFKYLLDREVIGFGVVEDNIIDINVEETE